MHGPPPVRFSGTRGLSHAGFGACEFAWREEGVETKNKLAYVLLALLLAGLAGLLQADRIRCPDCEHYNTWSHYVHVGCPNGSPPNWPQWNQEAMAPDTLEVPPPLPGVCPLCAQAVGASFCWCGDESTSEPFWP